MNREEFEKNMYITYLDEVINYEFKEVSYKSIVSITMRKLDYINILEPKWTELRIKYGVTDGVCLHFNDIKALLNPTYFNRKEKDRNFSIEKIFCLDNKVNYNKLICFYRDVLNILKNINFKIIITGKRFLKPRTDKKIVEKYINTDWYIIFKDHLDNLANYMYNTSYNSESSKRKLLKTKLRYDGDFNLGNKMDIRNAFSQAIANGTSKFNDKFIKECFDNLKFVDKTEVGKCTICPKDCNIRGISHAGNEILDFIALYISNFNCQVDMLKDYVKFGNKTENEAKDIVDKKNILHINGKLILSKEVLKGICIDIN
ncbi:MAG: hypothetical protein H2184_16180 [Candidatus Galacturonibacter soehngenii]|nr:hypothetical protein [Candidatus Galacturonibacter soehngenii]